MIAEQPLEPRNDGSDITGCAPQVVARDIFVG
jgi:hypothetical protein